jgi:hypothetical protein
MLDFIERAAGVGGAEFEAALSRRVSEVLALPRWRQHSASNSLWMMPIVG